MIMFTQMAKLKSELESEQTQTLMLANNFEFVSPFHSTTRRGLIKLQETGVAYLVVRDLLQVQVAGVDHLHARVAVVSAAEGAPVFRVGVERVCLLPAALRRSRGCD